MLRNRLILAALWIFSLVGISFYGGPLTYGFFAVMTILPIVLLLYLLLVLARFKIYQHLESREIVSNHKIPFYFTLQNEDLFAFSAVRVTFYSDFSVIDGLSDDNEYELLPKDKIKKETGLICKYRGEYNVGIRSVTLRDFLCIFKITYKNKEALRVRVVPDIITLPGLKSIDVESVSARDSLANPAYPDASVRDYITGDDARRINWKQSAKTGHLMVKNYIGEERNSVGLIIDPYRISDKDTEYLPIENRILETAIALCKLLESKRIPVSVYRYASGVKETSVDSPESFNDFYRLASDFSFERDAERVEMYDALSLCKSISEKKTVFIVTADANESVLMFSKSLNQNDIQAIVYSVGDETADETPVSPYIHTKIIPVPTTKSLVEVI